MIDCETGRSTGLFFFREMGFERRGGDFFGVLITYENWGNEHQCVDRDNYGVQWDGSCKVLTRESG